MCDSLSSKDLYQCPICFSLLSDEPCHQLSCGHVFHRNCITRWKSSHSSCPVCRENITDPIVGTGKLLDREVEFLRVSSVVKTSLESGGLGMPLARCPSFRSMQYPKRPVTVANFPHEVLVFDVTKKILKLEGVIPTSVSRMRQPPFLSALSSSSLVYPGARLSNVVAHLRKEDLMINLTPATVAYIVLVLLKASEVALQSEVSLPTFTTDDVFLSYEAVCWLIGFQMLPSSLLKGKYLTSPGTVAMPKDARGSCPISVLPRPETPSSSGAPPVGFYGGDLGMDSLMYSSTAPDQFYPPMGMPSAPDLQATAPDIGVEFASIDGGSSVRIGSAGGSGMSGFRSSHMPSSSSSMFEFNSGVLAIAEELGLTVPILDYSYKAMETALKDIIKSENVAKVFGGRVASLPDLPEVSSLPSPVVQPSTVRVPSATPPSTTTSHVPPPNTTSNTTSNTTGGDVDNPSAETQFLRSKPGAEFKHPVFGCDFRHPTIYPADYTNADKRRDFFRRGLYSGIEH
ncbi:hypothetical protein ADUPG1_011399, partial [Aduncisulcus paluster]